MASSFFPVTNWTVLISAKSSEDSEVLARARDELCSYYWQPLYVYARAQGKQPSDAEDLVQAFLARLLDSDRFLKADREIGKFRSFLLSSFKNFIIDAWKRARTEKRGGDQPTLSLDIDSVEREFVGGESGVSPERSFDRQWAKTVIARSLERLEVAWQAPAKRELFGELKPFLTLDPNESLTEIATRLGRKPGSVRMSLNRLRDDYRVIIHQTLGETLAPGQDPEEELRYLIGLLIDS